MNQIRLYLYRYWGLCLHTVNLLLLCVWRKCVCQSLLVVALTMTTCAMWTWLAVNCGTLERPASMLVTRIVSLQCGCIDPELSVVSSSELLDLPVCATYTEDLDQTISQCKCLNKASAACLVVLSATHRVSHFAPSSNTWCQWQPLSGQKERSFCLSINRLSSQTSRNMSGGMKSRPMREWFNSFRTQITWQGYRRQLCEGRA